MRMDQALGAADDWRTIIALHLNLGRQPIADMWLAPGQVAAYDFVPLSSTAAIIAEAAAMKNCLRTYGYNLAHNRSRLWSMRRDGARVVTLKVACAFRDPLPMIVELRGPGNADVPRELSWAARKWLHMHDLSQIAARPHPLAVAVAALLARQAPDSSVAGDRTLARRTRSALRRRSEDLETILIVDRHARTRHDLL